MKTLDFVVDTMENNVIYTIKDIVWCTGLSPQKTAIALKKLVEKGYVIKVKLGPRMYSKLFCEYGYMLKVD